MGLTSNDINSSRIERVEARRVVRIWVEGVDTDGVDAQCDEVGDVPVAGRDIGEGVGVVGGFWESTLATNSVSLTLGGCVGGNLRWHCWQQSSGR